MQVATSTVTKKQDLILRPCFFSHLWDLSITKMKSQILSICNQRKASARALKINGSFWPTDIHAAPLSPKSAKANFQVSKLDRWFQVVILTYWFLRPEFTKNSLKKVAKYDKILLRSNYLVNSTICSIIINKYEGCVTMATRATISEATKSFSPPSPVSKSANISRRKEKEI